MGIKLADESQIDTAKILLGFNLAVQYGIAIHNIVRIYNLVAVQVDSQNAQFNSSPNFLAIQYSHS